MLRVILNLKLSDVAGLPIGHVPKKNCSLFHKRFRQSGLTSQLWFMGVDRKRGDWDISDFVISCVPKLCVSNFPRAFRIFRVTPSFPIYSNLEFLKYYHL